MDSSEIDFTNAEMLRRNAEAKLKKSLKRENPYEKTDSKRLLHELQVHQIELEMQNEELRRAYETAEAALKKHTILFDLSPMGYFTLNSEGTISELNFTGSEILGEKRFSLIGSNFKLFVSEESKTVFNKFFKKVYSSNAKESCEIQIGEKNKTSRSVYLEAVVSEDDQKCFLSILDISKFNLWNK